MEEEKQFIIHKVQAGYNYIVYRTELNGKIYYKIPIEQKLIDGQKLKGFVQVRFKTGVELKDRTKIKIKKAIENFYFAKSDIKHYNPIFYYLITDFENIDDTVQDYNEALENTEEDFPF